MNKKLLFIFSLFFLMGCGLTSCALDSLLCGAYGMTGKDNAHCYQWMAVQSSDPESCENVQSDTWAGSGQNPPKDKCYLEIAVKTGNPDTCLGAEGGMNGYDRKDCYDWMGADGQSADACEGHEYEADCRKGIAEAGVLGGQPNCGDDWSWSGSACVPNKPLVTTTEPAKTEKPEDTAEETPEETPTPIVKPPIVDEADDKDVNDEDTIDDDEASATGSAELDADKKDDEKDGGTKKSALENAVDNLAGITDNIDKAGEKAEELKNDLTNAVTNIFSAAPVPPTPAEEKQTKLSELVADIEDQDARSAIVKAFAEEKKRRDDMTIEQQRELLLEIRDQFEFNSIMDGKANTLKAETYDKLTQKVDALVEKKKEGAWAWFKEKTYGWVKGRTPEKYKDAAALAEARYNKAAEKYNDALDSYGKGKDYFDRAKKAYDELKQVMDNVRRLQDKVASGKITEGQASAIKGGVLLGKGLEYTTKYIPVFGETISEITAGTFQATMKFAEKRAERTTRLNACIEDPEHCDPNGISAY